MKRLLSILLAACLLCALCALPVVAVDADPADEWHSAYLSADGVAVQIDTQGAAVDWHLYVSHQSDDDWLILVAAADGRNIEQVAETVPVRITLTLPVFGDVWVYHLAPGEPVPDMAAVASCGLVGMAVDDLLVMSGDAVQWAAPTGWLPDAYWEQHKHGDAAVLGGTETAEPSDRAVQKAGDLPDDDANPNTGL